MNATASALVAPVLQASSPQPCLIVNPRSFRASRGLASQAVALARRYGAQVLEASEPSDLRAALDELRARGQARIAVLSGDGTVQAIAQYIALAPQGVWLPQLLLLGGGRSNVTAKAFGGHPPLEKLEAVLRCWQDGKALLLQERQLLRIEQDGLMPQHGFLLAGAVIDYGIRLCRQHRRSGQGWLHRGPLADLFCLARLSAQVIRRRSPLPPYPQLRITTANGDELRAPTRLLLATTLEHRGGLYNPYADRGEGAVRVTAVAANAPRFWRHLPGLVRGSLSADMTLQNGYLSGRCQRAEVLGLAGYSLDGEGFDADPATPLVIRAGARLRIVVP